MSPFDQTVTILRRHKRDPDGNVIEHYAVPCVTIASAMDTDGQRLIPNPAGKASAFFDSLEAAIGAVRQAGFEPTLDGQAIPGAISNASQAQTPPPPSEARTVADWLARGRASLLSRLDDREAAVRGQAAEALGALGATEAIPKLIVLLGQDDATLRRHAIDALASFGAHAISPLLSCYEQSSATHTPRLSVMQAFEALLERPEGAEYLGLLLPCVVEKGLQDANWLVRGQAATVLAQAARLNRATE